MANKVTAIGKCGKKLVLDPAYIQMSSQTRNRNDLHYSIIFATCISTMNKT